ncbi:sugar O-acetyltransferase [Photobacterium gaetbulicola]|uniref:Nodulation protein L n=1 Tax=Photobacterium gaetbulicola Gung47 TaxID=658445 RepID=A0A0C5WW30_9GAMM|nr:MULTISPECIES: sugar O-acetyltransferase [Photobacterium]AJR09229.1 hexapeptide repeat-containing acetyltransferase [Photobacterium gaetbulicola Gung47]PSU11724.1 sugar O-acetyltransferase [Photobacterium gaetbulicola]WEM41330.1 sugar O-acetyltransferase [Photobacterium sp. DA100]
MTEFEKMLAGKDFDGSDQGINHIRDNAAQVLMALNQTIDDTQRSVLLSQLMGDIPDSSIVRSPFHCEFGKTIYIGEKTFINMNVTMLDGAKITIGNNVLIGPNTQLYCASHPLNYLERRQWATTCKPITVEDDVWIGGNVVINQGVTIGARSVIAANSVVNSDVPPDSLYGGTPAKLIRRIHENEQN